MFDIHRDTKYTQIMRLEASLNNLDVFVKKIII
jgi:hypothetical protein